MVLLSTGRWNPRVGKSRRVGQIYEWFAISIFAIVILGCCFPIDPLSFLFTNTLGILVMAIMCVPVVWFRVRRRQFQNVVFRNDFFLCPWCQYVLVDLQDSGLCPECGSTYERALCRLLYQSSYAPKERDAKKKIMAERRAWRRAILLRDEMIEPTTSQPDLEPPQPESGKEHEPAPEA